MRVLPLIVLAGCGFADLQPVPPGPRPVEESFAAYGGGGSAEAVAVLPGGDLVVVGCERGEIDFERTGRTPPFDMGAGNVFVTRIDRVTERAVWTRRSASPCGTADNWTVPRVAVVATGATVRIWVAAHGWGRGPYAERDAPTTLLSFDVAGALDTQRELAPGLRVRAMAALPGDRVAIAGQSALASDKSTAFVAALDARGADIWRTPIAAPHVTLVESLAADGDRILVSGNIDGEIEVVVGVGRGRESVGFVHELRARDGGIAKSWWKRYPGINVDDVRVAIAGGEAIIAYGVSQRVGNPWPAGLPPMPPGAFTSFLVEPLADKPAWRRAFTGTTHTSVMSLAATKDRVAVVIDAQAGSIDLGRGTWESTYFNLGGFVELATSTGATADARRITATGEHGRVFVRAVIWDGAAFTAVGETRGEVSVGATAHSVTDDAPFVWRIGATRVAMN